MIYRVLDWLWYAIVLAGHVLACGLCALVIVWAAYALWQIAGALL